MPFIYQKCPNLFSRVIRHFDKYKLFTGLNSGIIDYQG
jgi:hypothetical protein